MAGSSDEDSPNSGDNGRCQSPLADDLIHVDPVPNNSSVPKPKRLACMICRKRKLKCDGVRPSCSTCSRLGHDCMYNEQRRKSGPKRGYVKALEERLKQVETLLKTQEPTPGAANGGQAAMGIHGASKQGPVATAMSAHGLPITTERDLDRWRLNGESPRLPAMDDFSLGATMSMPMDNDESSFSWEMIGLGLEEPLPPQETIDELHQIYFEKVHPSIPMVHKYRYLAAMNLAPNQRPPVCLRYAMWTLACALSDKYRDMRDLFYQRSRKYVEADTVKGYGEHIISVSHCQTHVLLASYEMKMMYFPRAWLNTGVAVRSAQMLGLHRLDGNGLDVKQCLPAARDWTEREERRRTFWMAFCEDRYTSIGTGWPMSVDEQDITTNMPSSEDAFEMSRPESTPTLRDCVDGTGAAKMAPLGGIVLMACLFGRNLVHLHRPDSEDNDHDLNGPFWKRHRQMDNILLNTSLSLPSHLKLPEGMGNPNVVFTNMCIHTSTICLHQAAIFKADKNSLPDSVSGESKVRCITAANEIASIMRTVSHMDLNVMNPFIAFCLYVAARVFIQYLKSRPEDGQSADSLRFLASAMNALKRRTPLTESFLVQLDVDFEALAIRIPQLRNAFYRSDSPGAANQDPACQRIFNEQQSMRGSMGRYTNECHFMKTKSDSGNLATGPEIAQVQASRTLDTSLDANMADFSTQPHWLPTDQGLPILTPDPGSSYNTKSGPGSGAQSRFGDGFLDGHDAMETSEPPNSGPTPNSTSSGMGGPSGPEPRSAAHLVSGAGHSGGFGTTTSPMTAQRGGLGGGGGGNDRNNVFVHRTNSNSGSGGNSGGGGGGGYGLPDTPGLDGATSASRRQAGGGFGIGQDWLGVHRPANEGPNVGEQVLRSLMNMGPMDAIDLSCWESEGSGNLNGSMGSMGSMR